MSQNNQIDPQDFAQAQQDIKTLQDLIRTHVHNGALSTRINLNTDVLGLFETVSVAPTLAPNNIYEQIKIYSNGSSYRLYWYDTTNRAWRAAGGGSQAGSAYGGYINSDGTAGTPMPSGWTTSKTAGGTYKVTHNLGSTSYVVAGDAITNLYNTVITSRNSNDFTIETYNIAGLSLADSAVDFILLLTA